MKTAKDIYDEIGIPCCYCKYAFTPPCAANCIDLTLHYMREIAENMVLDGEY